MERALRKLSCVFAAGAAGGVTNSIALWLFGLWDITAAAGVHIAPQLTPPWLYPRIVWGGIWGVLFLVPLFKNSYITRGLLWSLGPTLVQLFVVFPIKAHKGSMGLDLGTLTPLFVIIFNAVWGITASYFLKIMKE